MDELVKYVELKGGSIWTGEAEEFMMYVDHNKDGKVSLVELQVGSVLMISTTHRPTSFPSTLSTSFSSTLSLQESKNLSPVKMLKAMDDSTAHLDREL
jgi:hypothetical protein